MSDDRIQIPCNQGLKSLVVVLPSEHRGGELAIRHEGREVVVVGSGSDEAFELQYAAFYADCEHEVRPITSGYRVCLVFNLVQVRRGRGVEVLKVPRYTQESEVTGSILLTAFDEPEAPAKLVWLLAHQYSPAGLSFASLKGADAAVARTLLGAAERADCAVHLGIVHIEETGYAEELYSRSHGYRRRGRYWDNVEEGLASKYAVIEVSDRSQ